MTKWSFTLLRALLPTLLCLACAEPNAYTCDPTITNCFTYAQTQAAGTTSATAGSTTASGNMQSTTTGGVAGGGATTAGDTTLTTGGITTTTTTTGGGTTTTGGSNTTTTTGGGGMTTTTGGSVTTTTGGGTTAGGGTTTTTTTGGVTNITSRFAVDDFNNAAAFTSNVNSESPPNYIGQSGMTIYSLNTSTNQVEMDCNSATCYWWCLLAAQGSCLNVTGFTHFEVTLQGAPGADASFQLQQNDPTCQSTSFTGSQTVLLSSYVNFDSQVHTVYIPLTAFNAVDQVHTRAISILNFVPNTPIYISSINLVTMN